MGSKADINIQPQQHTSPLLFVNNYLRIHLSPMHLWGKLNIHKHTDWLSAAQCHPFFTSWTASSSQQRVEARKEEKRTACWARQKRAARELGTLCVSAPSWPHKSTIINNSPWTPKLLSPLWLWLDLCAAFPNTNPLCWRFPNRSSQLKGPLLRKMLHYNHQCLVLLVSY